MNKILRLFLAGMLAFPLTGCANNNSASPENNVRIVWNFGNADERCELFIDNNTERLYFMDFETMDSALLCSKPNCTHSNEDECSAFGMRNHPILYGDKLYFFDDEEIIGRIGKMSNNYSEVFSTRLKKENTYRLSVINFLLEQASDDITDDYELDGEYEGSVLNALCRYLCKYSSLDEYIAEMTSSSDEGISIAITGALYQIILNRTIDAIKKPANSPDRFIID